MRFFTTEGPVNCADHYCLPPLSRLDMEDVLALIRQKKYFLLHAPRQTGKTTCLLALADYLNAGGEYHAVYANIEAAQAAREDVAQGMEAFALAIRTPSAGYAGLLGADLGLRRRLRGGRGAPGHLRPHAGQALGREGLCSPRTAPRPGDHRVGRLSCP
jgi:hypothetical protein